MSEKLFEVDASNDKLYVGEHEIRLPDGRYTQDDMTAVIAGETANLRVAARWTLGTDRDGHAFSAGGVRGSCTVCGLLQTEHGDRR